MFIIQRPALPMDTLIRVVQRKSVFVSGVSRPDLVTLEIVLQRCLQLLRRRLGLRLELGLESEVGSVGHLPINLAVFSAVFIVFAMYPVVFPESRAFQAGPFPCKPLHKA